MKIAIIGAGNMGGAIARGIAAKSPSAEISVSNPSMPKLEALRTEFPAINITTDNAEAVEDAETVILAVKPWLMEEVIADLDYLKDKTVVSVAAGISLDRLDRMIANRFDGSAQQPAFRVIPDTAAAIGRSMTFISSRRAPQPLVDEIAGLFTGLGRVAIIEERLMDAATALSSCGIAYVYKFVQAFVQAGVQLGFRPADAQAYVNATIDGAIAMLEVNGTTPQQEIDKVTTPGGMTIKGINQLDHAGFTSAVIQGVLKPLEK